MADKFKACVVNGCNGNAHPSTKGARGWCQFHYNRWYQNGDPELGRSTVTGSPLTYFRSLLSAGDQSDCLIWPFARNRDGYAILKVHSKTQLVTRLICHELHGAPPSSKHVAAHSCGQGHLGCVNRCHLRWATPSDNMQDAIKHGTWNGSTRIRGVRSR